MKHNSTGWGLVATTLATLALVALSLAGGVATAGSHGSKINGGTLSCCRK
ncbi:MAG: hypothetical protein ACLGIA_11900 [Actinomycetes bacterium]